ncbi:hypothetical protein F5Y14DRAFT_417755 [Nemania sp. NC0429]|nr:hypothetical protein F5Y14DRAFT_417755 [Nemania sp. NC0429]
MIFCTAYALLAVGFASQILAEPFRDPYQPKLARMSTSNILGIRRRGVEGYSPMEQLCGDGDTCAEACGKGFKQCASKDDLTHCYNSLKKQTCCPGGTGDSCDNGYFCSADEGGKTWCCPEGLSLKECARKYGIAGPLTSEAPPTSTTSTTHSKSSTTTSASTTKDTTTTKASTTKPTTTSTKSKKPESTESSEATTTTKVAHHASTSKSKPEETSSTTPSASTTTLLVDVSSAATSTEPPTAQTTVFNSASSSAAPASSPTSSISQGGCASLKPAHGLVLFVAGALIALF